MWSRYKVQISYEQGEKMKNKYSLSIWADNQWIEDYSTWFVWGKENILCHFDSKTDDCELLTQIPDTLHSKFRLTPFCMKYHDDIYCMPGYGKSIWIYNTISRKFDEIYINGSDGVILNMRDFWEYENKIYVVSNGLGQIVEIDPVVKKIENYYRLCNEGSISKSVKVGTKIYGLFCEIGYVYQFDLKTKEIIMYKIPDIGRKFSTFCFDGKKFWLGGFRKEIYVWDKNTNNILTINGFPKEFGIYDFSKETDGIADCITDEYKKSTFAYSTVVEEKVWFIPYCTNKIIYVNKHTYQLYVFEIDEERETKESILERSTLGYKYLLNYVKDDRYIGIYSLKNQCILEIDSVELKYEYKQFDYHISDIYVKEYADLLNNIFYEGDVWSREICNRMIQMKDNNIHNIRSKSVGSDIYKKIAYDIE